jgi:hypothetical protein
MPRYAIIGVEGPHDQAFVSKLLIGLGFQDFTGRAAELDPFWETLKPKYPKNGRLYVRMDMPSILFTADLSIAVYAAEGSGLKDSFPKAFVNHPPYRVQISAFGIVADADTAGPARVAADYSAIYRAHFPNIPNRPGVVDLSAIRTGIYVVPDNTQPGVLETLIIPCGAAVYPKHMKLARDYLNGFAAADKAHWRNFDDQKALVATVASVLRPGLTNTVTIKHDSWLCPATAAQVQPFVDFLKQLLSLP